MQRQIFGEEHEMFRDAVRSFLQNEIAPHRDRWAEAGIVDREAYEKMGEQGMLLMWADEKYGGAGVPDFRYEQILLEENARYGDLGFFAWLHSRLVAPYIGEFGTEEQKQEYLPKIAGGEAIFTLAALEEDGDLWPGGVNMRAFKQGDAYVLSGTKTFVPDAKAADYIIVAALPTGPPIYFW